MSLETGTYINDLVVTNPTSTDAKSAGDDHFRLIKSLIKATFANITGAVTVTHTQLNTVVDRILRAGDTMTGTHDYTGATIRVATQSAGNSTTNAASTAFVAATAFSSALPAQAGNSGLFVTTDGTTASWAVAVSPFQKAQISQSNYIFNGGL